MFCVSLGGNKINRYNIHNCSACYISCQKPECNEKAIKIARSINKKIARVANNFLDGETEFTINGKTYLIDTHNGRSFEEMLVANELENGYCIGVPDNTYVSAEYDYTDPREVTEDNFNVFVYATHEDGFWYKIYLNETGVVSCRCANFFPCK
jgi:hypothetical protein